MLEIKNRRKLKEIIKYEKELNFSHLGKYQCLLAILKSHPRYINWKYIKLLRIAGYYYNKRNINIFYSLMYFWKCRKKNKLGRKLGIEMNEKNIGKGVEICNDFDIVKIIQEKTFSFLELQAVFEWLLKNHFDYRGLIEKSLAIDATGLNIY